MLLSQQVVSLPIAKRLKELGVKQESLFWWNHGKKTGNWYVYASRNTNGNYDTDWPSAFTCAELGEMLPTEIKNDTLNMAKCGYGEAIQWQVFYSDDNTLGPRHTVCSDNEANARGLMLCYLLENGLIKLEK